AKVRRRVMRGPVVFALGVIAILVVLAAPLRTVQFGGIDERVLPPGTESRVVSEKLKTDFAGDVSDPIFVLVSGASSEQTEQLRRQIESDPDARGASVVASRGTSTLLAVRYSGAANSDSARNVVHRIRALPRPGVAEVMVGGKSADIVDQLAGLRDRLPLMGLLVAGITFVLL